MIDREIRLYTFLSCLFWVIALGAGDGGNSGVHMEWEGAMLNFVLLIPLWRGHWWAGVLLAIQALATGMAVGTGAFLAWGPALAALALIALAQFLLLYFWTTRSESAPEELAGI